MREIHLKTLPGQLEYAEFRNTNQISCSATNLLQQMIQNVHSQLLQLTCEYCVASGEYGSQLGFI